ncbi:hypothetical protein QJQ45_028226, partial [Haematococcus lacustris]
MHSSPTIAKVSVGSHASALSVLAAAQQAALPADLGKGPLQRVMWPARRQLQAVVDKSSVRSPVHGMRFECNKSRTAIITTWKGKQITYPLFVHLSNLSKPDLKSMDECSIEAACEYAAADQPAAFLLPRSLATRQQQQQHQQQQQGAAAAAAAMEEDNQPADPNPPPLTGMMRTGTKDTDPTDPNKYRMLAVSSVLYRLYANVLRHVLTAWCMTHKVLPAEQFGFIPGRSTMQPMFILRHLVHAQKASADAKHRKLFTAFIDFKQAYDHIPRQQLWEHLRVGVKLPQPLLACLEGLYRDDSYVLIDGPHRTPLVTPDQGVKQGCPISPLLFALYVHDISKEFLSPVDAVRVQGTPVTHFMYADDLTLVSTSSHGLQRLVCQLQGFADRKHLTVNVGKSKFQLAARELMGDEFTLSPDMVLGTKAMEVKWLE